MTISLGMKAWVSGRVFSKTYRHFSLAIARRERLVTILCLIGALCVSSSAYAEGPRVWSRMISSEPANSADRAQEFVLYGVDQGDRHLVGTWSYTNGAVGSKTPPRVVIEGTRTTDGVFWPDVKLEARKGRTGKWRKVPNPSIEGERATVTIEPNAINFDLMVNLDAFKPLMRTYESGRIVLKTGRTSQFELKDLVPPEQEIEELRNESTVERAQVNSTSFAYYAPLVDDPDARNPSSSMPIRTLTRVGSAAQPRLGSSTEDFRSAWGPPIREEVLSRTATLVWRLADQSKETFPTGIFQAEVSFLDQIACEIVFRSKRWTTPDKMVRLARLVLPQFSAQDFAKPRSDVNGIRIYDLEDGTSVSLKEHEGHMLIVIRGQCYLRNEAVFDGEAATVRPPTSNH